MVSVAAALTELWLLFLLSLVASALVFPFVFVFSFLYSLLEKRLPRTPRVLLMAFVTFAAVFIALALLEVYVGYTLGEVASSLAPPA